MGTALAVAVTAASVPGMKLGQYIVPQQREVVVDATRLCLKYAHAGAGEFVQRPATDAANHNGVHLMAGKTGDRIASSMLVNLVAVADRGQFAGFSVHYHKSGR